MGTYLRADEACARLRVKRATLYTYVSRGLIHCVGGPGPDGKRYASDDVERLLARSKARRGHGAVAAGALRWGEPVLDSAITSVGEAGFSYRGHLVSSLAQSATLEEVAGLLWEHPWPAQLSRAPFAPAPASEAADSLRPSSRYLDRCFWMLRTLAAQDPARREDELAREVTRAARLVEGFALCLSAQPVPWAGSLAETAARALEAPPHAVPLLRAALVLCADHELNVSSFAARVAASSGADLYACLGAALGVFAGPKHGAASDPIEAFLDQVPERNLAQTLRSRAKAGLSTPGVGHPLYPSGDPRSRCLLELIAREPWLSGRARAAANVFSAIEETLGTPPTIDAALVVLSRGLGLPAGSATALFAVGRSTGWIAHILEQRRSNVLLRPRARYTGPAPGSLR